MASLKAFFFLNSKSFSLPSPKKILQAAPGAHERYSTLNSEGHARQLGSRTSSEAPPSLWPGRPSAASASLSSGCSLSSHAELRTNPAWHISSLLVICSTKELGMVISNSDPTPFSKWLLSVCSFSDTRTNQQNYFTKEQRIWHPFQENLLGSIKLYNKNGVNYFYLAEGAEHKTLWSLRSK